MELSCVEGTESMFFGLYAVADGVGGCEGGGIASRLALRIFAKSITDSLLTPSHQLN
jgi:serine/threonine protein phosphatase PrpC